MKCERIIKAALNSVPSDSPIASTLRSRIENLGWAPAYAEPGYDNPEKGGIFFGDWNTIDRLDEPKQPGWNIMKRLGDALERAGAEIGWEDEWTTCCDCGKAIRQSADSYCWTPYFVWANECEIVCLDCADESVLDEYINEPTKCLPPRLKRLLTQAGFEQINRDEYESGLHPGQNDDLLKIFAQEKSHCDELIFIQDEQSQFYIRFSVWGRGTDKVWEKERREELEGMSFARLTREGDNGTSDWTEKFGNRAEPPTREEMIDYIIESERNLKH